MSLKKGAFLVTHPENWTKEGSNERKETKSSPRPISTAKLNASPRLHMQPINLLVHEGSY